MIRASSIFSGILAVFAVLGLLAGSAGAQKPRSADRGPDGMLTWKPFVAEPCEGCAGKLVAECKTCEGGKKKLFLDKCPECKGKKTVTCARCFGLGKTYDVAQMMSCPICDGRALSICRMCAGTGFLKMQDGSKGAACKLCDKKAMWPCELCGGKRFLKIDQIGGKPIEQATVPELEAYIKKIEGIADSTEAFLKPDSNKSIGSFDRIGERTIAVYPYFKNLFPAARKRSDFILEKLKADLRENHDSWVKGAREQAIGAANHVVVNHLNLFKFAHSVLIENAKQKAAKPAEGSGEKQ